MGELDLEKISKGAKGLLSKFPNNGDLKAIANLPTNSSTVDKLGNLDLAPNTKAHVFEDVESGVVVSFRLTEDTGTRLQITDSDPKTGEKMRLNFSSEIPNLVSVQTQEGTGAKVEA